MPTYEYGCAQGHTFEVFQKMSDDPVSTCPECGTEARRMISGGAGFLFKGDGFYITDYRSDDYKKKASAEGGAPSGDGAPKKATSGSDSGSGSDSSSPASSNTSSTKSSGDGGGSKVAPKDAS